MTDRDAISLREHFESVLKDRDRLYREQWEGHRREHDLIAHALSTSAKEVAEWRAASNEWRGALTDLSNKFGTREYVEQQDAIGRVEVRAVVARLDALEAAAEREAGAHGERIKNANRLAWLVGLGAGIVSVVVSRLIDAWTRTP